MNEKQIENLMQKLGLSREEAIEIIKEDEEIDKMPVKELNNDLTAEQKKAVKKATKTGTKKKTTTTKKERKVDETKKRLLNDFRVVLEGLGAEVEPLKTEAEMNFSFEKESYTIKLIKHRPPKA